MSTLASLSEDAKIGKYSIKAGEIVQINIDGLHSNSSEWQRPREFIPERFDSQNPLSLAPDGKKRKVWAFCPFLGGKRICFGKTLAVVNLKIFGVYMSQLFDMKFVDE